MQERKAEEQRLTLMSQNNIVRKVSLENTLLLSHVLKNILLAKNRASERPATHAKGHAEPLVISSTGNAKQKWDTAHEAGKLGEDLLSIVTVFVARHNDSREAVQAQENQNSEKIKSSKISAGKAQYNVSVSIPHKKSG
ncbi:hypothetical protein Glove_99g69 [Diversispora epigaea]|uniref:Uncharacterized protein n=1 Tax=Diversispora epigaea TaxID=1348612 RepID=A0A397J543_9GLOM|nr:hypothetical protein Glove_99g69 [Diversispora epigaea]